MISLTTKQKIRATDKVQPNYLESSLSVKHPSGLEYYYVKQLKKTISAHIISILYLAI